MKSIEKSNRCGESEEETGDEKWGVYVIVVAVEYESIERIDMHQKILWISTLLCNYVARSRSRVNPN